jgi:aerobic-type carbon monoxide dehydrogenase small subunit (CoxS/CutS family)
VIIDGRPERACLVKVSKLGGKKIETIEGLSQNGELHRLQQAFIDEGAVQCVLYTWMIMAAKALLDRNRNPSLDEIKKALQGNLCRCTGYLSIIRAVQRAAKGWQTVNSITSSHGIQIIGLLFRIKMERSG